MSVFYYTYDSDELDNKMAEEEVTEKQKWLNWDQTNCDSKVIVLI